MLLIVILTYFTLTLGTKVSDLPTVRRYYAPIQGKYIVGISDSANTTTESILSAVGARPNVIYSHGFHGFGANLTEAQVKKLSNNPNVGFVEQDAVTLQSSGGEHSDVYHVDSIWNRTAMYRSNTNKSRGIARRRFPFGGKGSKKFPRRQLVIQKPAPWALARISERKPHRTKYTYHKSAGVGSCVYVIGTGFNADSPEFEGRAESIKDFGSSDSGRKQGRGTGVAAIIGSITYGVAKNTKIFDVNIGNDKGETEVSRIVQGIDFVTKDAPSRDCPKGVVVHISSLPTSVAFDKAIDSLTMSLPFRVFPVVGAGDNGELFPSMPIPSDTPLCVVGGVNRDDILGPWSNHGPYIHLFAPGGHVNSINSNDKPEVYTGTDMASAHVAGLGAYLMGFDLPGGSLCSYMQVSGIQNAIDMQMRRNSHSNNILINNRVLNYDPFEFKISLRPVKRSRLRKE
ncbi:hypothetical protein QQS21_001229 [Conoideocrella luteorostrata]|uniref:Subtilisin-like protein n=1 Tax=Conoideocrella luteorostrata TaxID=1105319 RepID=A0AAJ0FXR7_9HYPO|nr:hypothetical protein QQS21_001229 [Conoideocrella luteorostrata]